MCAMCRNGKAKEKPKGSNQLLTTNKLVFTVYIEKYTDVLIHSAYIEYEYEYLTHRVRVFKNIYSSTKYFRLRSGRGHHLICCSRAHAHTHIKYSACMLHMWHFGNLDYVST